MLKKKRPRGNFLGDLHKIGNNGVTAVEQKRQKKGMRNEIKLREEEAWFSL